MILRGFFAVQAFLVTLVTVLLMIQGVRRRLPHWTRRSWLKFISVMTIGAVLTAVVFAESWIADRWFSAALEASRDATSLWALAVLGVMMVGCGIITLTLFWFARGEPTRQFPELGRR